MSEKQLISANQESEKTLKQMKIQTKAQAAAANAAKQAADAARASLRPWIKIDSVAPHPMQAWPSLSFHSAFDGKINLQFPSIQIDASIKNIGHSPATNIDIQPMIFFNYLQNGMTTYADTIRKE